MCVLASNLAAIAGSMAIISSRFSAIRALRSSTWSDTQSLKSCPSTAAHTLTIHCLGTFGRSTSSGRCWLTRPRPRTKSMIFSSERFLYCGTCSVFTSSLCTKRFLRIRMSLR